MDRRRSRDAGDIDLWGVKHDLERAVAAPQVLKCLRRDRSEGGGVEGSGRRRALRRLREQQACVDREAGLPLQGDVPSPAVARGRCYVIKGGLATSTAVGGARVHDRRSAMCCHGVEELFHERLLALAGAPTTRLRSPPMKVGRSAWV